MVPSGPHDRFMLTKTQKATATKIRPGEKPSLRDWSGVLARWILGALFIYMGMTKALDPVAFLKLIRQYEVVYNPYLLNSIAAALPWFEMFCGILLLLGVAVRGSALMLILMLIPFSILVFLRAQGIAETQGLAFCSVKFDCGCGTGEILICRKLTENAGLFLASLWVVFSRNQPLCLRFDLFRPRSQTT